jgi:NAD(P)-dependent dehydrogenase (short-subunit alcohol dehydrogenase family)
MNDLSGKTALVTGASKGIGRAIALAYAAKGANVALVARSKDALNVLAAQIGELAREALPIAADLGDEAEIKRVAATVLERFNRVDILVNNAGIIHPMIDLVDFDPGLWRRVIDVNLIGPALLTGAVLPSMIERGSGTVINVSSIGGRKGSAGRTAYRAAKSALINLTESVAAEAKPHGINVNCICPGPVDTEGFREAYPERSSSLALMRPEEIAEIAVFLASDASSAITGTAIDAFGNSNPLFQSG